MGSRVLVVGAGAVGGFYGGKLDQAGCEVSVVCRSDYEVVLEKGFFIDSSMGDFSYQPKVLSDIAECEGFPDYILVATKVLGDDGIARLIGPVVGPDSVIVLLQNGIDIEGPFIQSYPDHLIISGLAFVCLSRTGPGQILHEGFGRLVFGVYPKGADQRVSRWVGFFKDVDVPCKVSEWIEVDRWKKLVWNAAFNPISVLDGGRTTTQILEDRVLKSMVVGVMSEIVMLADCHGVRLPDDIIDRNISDTVKMPPYKTSMLLDMEQGRPLELEAILGNVVRMGGVFEVEIPYLRMIYQRLIFV